jgi:hypothetical protein
MKTAAVKMLPESCIRRRDLRSWKKRFHVRGSVDADVDLVEAVVADAGAVVDA